MRDASTVIGYADELGPVGETAAVGHQHLCHTATRTSALHIGLQLKAIKAVIRASLADDATSLADQMNVLRAQIADLDGRHDQQSANPALACRAELRRCTETEDRREKRRNDFIPISDVLAFMSALGGAVHQHVSDEGERSRLTNAVAALLVSDADLGLYVRTRAADLGLLTGGDPLDPP